MPPLDDQIRYARERIAAAKGIADLDAIELSVFGRKSGLLTLALKELGTLSPDARKQKGQELNTLKEELALLMAEKRSTLSSAAMSRIADTDRIDVTLNAPPSPRGHLHLIPEFIRQVEDVFGNMGFDVAHGPEVETDEYNFTLLNFAPDHPARDFHDTFWMEDGRLLRTHTSPVQIRYMQSHEPPLRMICPGRSYRKDADATHSPMFHQFEGLMIGKDVSLANMKGVMREAMRALISPNIEFRFRTSYFPFVEPGLEVDMRWLGEKETKEGAWLEVAGCGMVHPNVLKNVGIDRGLWQGFAFGFGVERLVMIKHGLTDMRALYEGDLRFLRQF